MAVLLVNKHRGIAGMTNDRERRGGDRVPQSGLMLGARMSFAHFLVSAAMNVPNPDVVAGIKARLVGSVSAALISLLSGQVQLVFGSISQLLEYIRAGKPRALAVTIANGQAVLPDVPTLREFLPGYEASACLSARYGKVIV